MKRFIRPAVLSAALAALLALSGCASLFAPPVHPGDSEAEVLSHLGKPAATYPDGNDKLLFYQRGFLTQFAYMARIAPDGRLVSYEQVWTTNQFAKLKPGISTKEDVLRTVGAPTEIRQYARIPYHAWNYGYKEAGVWDSMMSVYIDDNGIVQRLENGPDPRFDPGRFGFR